jgi:hypothetical protein
VPTRTAEIRPLTEGDFAVELAERAGEFLTGTSKCIAWRNITVDRFNNLIRRELFAEHDVYPWQPSDRIAMLGPIQDLLRVNEQTSEHPRVAHTDDEGVVETADRARHPLYEEFDCWRILCRYDDNRSATLWALHSSQKAKFESRVARMAADARTNSRLWKDFWAFKEAFHPIRHAYAITAHRAQGSTYERAYVSWRDILRNQSRSEAYRCLYVAVSRPRKELVLG